MDVTKETGCIYCKPELINMDNEKYYWSSWRRCADDRDGSIRETYFYQYTTECPLKMLKSMEVKYWYDKKDTPVLLGFSEITKEEYENHKGA